MAGEGADEGEEHRREDPLGHARRLEGLAAGLALHKGNKKKGPAGPVANDHNTRSGKPTFFSRLTRLARHDGSIREGLQATAALPPLRHCNYCCCAMYRLWSASIATADARGSRRSGNSGALMGLPAHSSADFIDSNGGVLDPHCQNETCCTYVVFRLTARDKYTPYTEVRSIMCSSKRRLGEGGYISPALNVLD